MTIPNNLIKRKATHSWASSYHAGEVVVGAAPVALDSLDHAGLELDVVRGRIATAERQADFILARFTQGLDLPLVPLVQFTGQVPIGEVD